MAGSTVDGFTVSSSTQEGSTGFGGTETTRQFAAQGKKPILKINSFLLKCFIIIIINSLFVFIASELEQAIQWSNWHFRAIQIIF